MRVCLENVLLRDNPCISPQGCYEVFLKTLFEKSVSVENLFEQASKNLSTYTRKNNVLLLLSFRPCYPTISE